MGEGFANSVSFGGSHGEPAPSFSPGAVVGRYALEARIGAGGFGEVWRARPLEGDPESRPVALKLARGPAAREALRRQGAAQRRLDHPGIVKVVDEGLDHDPPYVVFEHVAGCNLRDVLRRFDGMTDAADPLVADVGVPYEGPRPLTVEQRTRRLRVLFRDVAAALAHAHERGIVHGDLKPENVLLARGGRVLLTDFGLGTTASGSEVALSRSLASTALGGGTLAYLAPERHAGAPPTPSGDIWSFGIMLFEACHGRLPMGFERATGWDLEHVFAGCYAPDDVRISSGAILCGALGGAAVPSLPALEGWSPVDPATGRRLRATRKGIEPVPEGPRARRAAAASAGDDRPSPAVLARRLAHTAGRGRGSGATGVMGLIGVLGVLGLLGLSLVALSAERRAPARWSEPPVAVDLSADTRASVESIMRSVAADLREDGWPDSGGPSWRRLREVDGLRARGEQAGYRIVPDGGGRVVRAFPRVEGWPVLTRPLDEEPPLVSRAPSER
jgi:serine/threonine protein kinase